MGGQTANTTSGQCVWMKIATIFFLFAVASLPIAAKKNSRLPRSNPAHFTSSATKMEQTQPPATQDRASLHQVSIVVPRRVPLRDARRDDAELPPLNQEALRLSVQHRAPPSLV